MADRSKIEWTNATWTPVKGCTRVSEGCRNCYAEIMAARFSRPWQWGRGLARIVDTPQGRDHRWTGAVRFDEAELLKPLRWKKPRRIFVCSTSDLFQDGVPDEWIDRVFGVMAMCPQHTFQVLTKRPERMRRYCNSLWAAGEHALAHIDGAPPEPWPFPNVWLGTSAEDQTRADERIPHLLATPAAVRFLSCEPLLGPVDVRQWQHAYGCGCGWGGDSPLDFCRSCGWRGHAPGEIGDAACQECGELIEDYNACPECEGHDGDWGSFGPNSKPRLDWLIVGGESGPGARPMHLEWARSIRDQCAAAGVPFFFKQWGEWLPVEGEGIGDGIVLWPADGRDLGQDFSKWGKHPLRYMPGQEMWRVGKGRAGRLLDGAEHLAMPRHG